MSALPHRDGAAIAGAFGMSVAGCLNDAIGAHGLDPATLALWLDKVQPGLDELREDARTGRLPLLSIVRDTADIDAAATALDRLSRGASVIVFFGTGGSGLGGQTLAQVAGWNLPGAADEDQRRRPRIRFYDNLDPDILGRAIASLDPATTRFVVTSKSGNTSETLTQALVAIERVQKAGLGARLPELFLGLTEPAVAGRTNGLRQLLEGFGVPVLDHHTGIGGRYSVLTNVGLLPALARGFDARAIRAGAARLVDALLAGGPAATFAPALGAAVAIGLAKERGVGIQVMMPYADRLNRFSHWFVQLWAESLGKQGEGTSPIACLGPLDQHSQLQLFMDGPRDHLITVLRLPTAGQGPRVDPALAARAGLSEMAGRTVGDLVASQASGVPAALIQAGRPVRMFDVADVTAPTVGALLMHFMMETILAGRLLGVDPFDQPAVELGKRLSRERLVAG
ncbi:MAG: glucose-6-phosphate isomerase [Hyphomicrobiaceae bacterium]